MPIRFPAWPMIRVLREATFAWNLRNPENRCDAAKSDWAFVYSVVLAYLRHSLTDYNSLVDEANRAALRAEVETATRWQYTWLRPDTDPRGKVEPSDAWKPYKVLEDASSELADLLSVRAHLFDAQRREKDKARRELFTEHLKKTEEKIKQRRSLFERFPTFDGESTSPFIIWDHPTPGYLFGLRELAPNYIEETGIKCPKCGKAVLKTKRPLDLGAGIRLVCLSCECMSIAVSPGWDRPNVKAWSGLLEPE